MADGLAEPSDLVLTADGEVLVVESAAHRLTRLAPGALTAAGANTVDGPRHRAERQPTDVAPGEVTLDVIFTPAPGQKLDETYGPSTRLVVSASPPELLRRGGRHRHRAVPPAGASTRPYARGVLQVTAQAATCDADVEHAACHLTRQDWGVPVRVVDDGATRLPLVLRGLDA